MSTIRLYSGLDSDEMAKRLREYQCSDAVEHISALEVRESVLDDGVIEAIVELLQARQVKTVQLDDCGAYMNRQAIRMARALGAVENVRLSEPTFLSRQFLEVLLLSATNLTNLRIQGPFDYRLIQALANGLKENTSVQVLDISRSRLDSFFALAEGLKENTSVVDLKLRSLGLNDDNVDVILKALRGHPALTVLDLSFNHFRNLESLASLIADPGCRLVELSLGYQNMWQSPEIEFATLARALRKNKSVKSLSLPRNKLRDTDVLLLTTALTCNSTLLELDLRENYISNEGISALAGVLKHGTGIRRINVSKNPFDEVGSLALLDAVQSNYHLFHIEVTNSSQLNHEIRYTAALNRGGRGLLFMNPPLALWPLVLQRINNLDFENGESSIKDVDIGSFQLDVLQHMLRNPTLFEGIVYFSKVTD